MGEIAQQIAIMAGVLAASFAGPLVAVGLLVQMRSSLPPCSRAARGVPQLDHHISESRTLYLVPHSMDARPSTAPYARSVSS